MSKIRPSIGLALGSGGFRGLAHIGVIKVLEKNNIPVDYIAGSSIGALISTLYAYCLDILKIEKLALNTSWRRGLSIFDLGRHGGLIKGAKIEKLITNWLEHICPGKPLIPLAIVTTDLNTGQPVIFKKGDFVKPIHGSIAIPLIFEPINYQGKLLVDGGLVNPVPDDIVKNMGADKIIAVNLDQGEFKPLIGKKNPTFINIGLRSLDIMAWYLNINSIHDADVIINPLIKEEGIVGFDKFLNRNMVKRLIKIGETAAEKELPRIKKLVN
ncbi:MAG: patatin-like phospholipase family protein [Patescibacteria group bacterium]